MTAFEEMGVMREIARAVEDMDWSLPTDVQSEAIPMILGGGDVLMAAETGSGKTGAFCLPILQTVFETLKDLQEGKSSKMPTKHKGSSSWKMSVYDRGDAMSIDPDGLLCQSRDQQKWHGTRSNKAVVGQGKYYYEATVTDEGLCRVGWSTDKASLDLGTDKWGYGFGGTGKKSYGKQFDSYGEAFGINDTIGCYLDLQKGEIKWSKNGIDFGKAYDIPDHMRNEKFFAAVVLKNAEMSFNFGTTPFKFNPPQGFTALFKAPKDSTVESKIAAGAATAKPAPNAPQAIIIEPSRELAEQTLTQIQKFKTHLENPVPRELLIVGGVNVKDQVDVLTKGVDIVCGTPGRLEDLISTGKLLLSACRFFVLDEADGLLSQGYGDLINRLHAQIPKVTNDGKRLQMVVCSATLHSFDVKKMAERLMYFPTWIDLKGQDSVPETVHHCVCMVDPLKDTRWKDLRQHVETDGVHSEDKIQPHGTTQETYSEAVKILKGEYTVKAIEEHNMDRALIFCRTKIDCDNMEKYLRQRGQGKFSCVCLHGDRKPQERKDNLQKFKDGKVKFLICTDVAARGIDVSGVPFVINVTLPDEKQNYIHRIGRVGRAERMGLAFSLVAAVKEKVWYHSNCTNRGRGCYNTKLTDRGGCCIWYNEPQLLSDVEEHLDITIDKVEPEMKVPINEFDGKVTYGQKRAGAGSGYKGHVETLAPAVMELAKLEKRVQTSFIDLKYKKKFCVR
ncbi:ATP-dependent RNA helicase DDX1-like [Mya arenaria]|uniref:ATP-dependent RNA helicase DDX1-like n=1 Tax=Mya arenaria TaxID=6604 RepID=UPI0022E2C0B9|nr:ATP-dependent RNA helicase DDX1-like [Mya arenaria]